MDLIVHCDGTKIIINREVVTSVLESPVIDIGGGMPVKLMFTPYNEKLVL